VYRGPFILNLVLMLSFLLSSNSAEIKNLSKPDKIVLLKSSGTAEVKSISCENLSKLKHLFRASYYWVYFRWTQLLQWASCRC